MKKLLLFVIFLSEAVILNAQIQITSTDVENVLAPGKAWVLENKDSLNVQMNIGSASSSAQNWTVPDINWSDTISEVNVAPSNTPYASDFPTATYAQYFNGMLYGYSASSYSYYRIDNNGLYSLGSAVHVAFGPIDTTLVTKDTTYYFGLPITYGSSKLVSSDTSEFLGFKYITITTQSVDAFGNITLPFGTFPALRITENVINKTYQNGTLMEQTMQPSFSWITTAGIFDADIDTSAGISGMVTLTSASIIQFTNAPLAVNDRGVNTPSAFMLYQNYPNPFNPSTKIRYTIPAASSNGSNNLVILKVYDVLGNEIATLVNEQKPAGTYEVEFSAKSKTGTDLPSGIYFYRLTAGNFVQTQKMILLK